MFQDFQLSVTPIDRDRYLLRTEIVYPGVPLAEVQVEWDVENWLRQTRQLMDDPLVRLLQGDGPLLLQGMTPEQDEAIPADHPLRSFGQELYSALFSGQLRDSWITAQGIAHSQRAVLRFRLGLKGDLLHRIPWETLHSEGSNPCSRFLATKTELAFSRYQIHAPLGSPTLRSQGSEDTPVRILMAIAGPNDQETLDLQQEAEILREELNRESPREAPKIDLQVLTQPGRDELTQALERGHYDVFHYAGHSQLGDAGGNIYLVSPVSTLTETLSGKDLGGLLVNNGVKLAVFNSCRSADTAWSQANAGMSLAQTLVHCGIPSVLAMAEQIPDEAALRLTRLFYRNLQGGYPIDLSLNRARQCLISTFDSRQLYWALPVLYLHETFDGCLLSSQTEIDVSKDVLSAIDEDIPLSVLGGDRFLDEFNDIEDTDDDAEDFVQSVFEALDDTEDTDDDYLMDSAEFPEMTTHPTDSPEDDEAENSELNNADPDVELSSSGIVATDISDSEPPKRPWWPWIIGGVGTIAIASLGLFLNLPTEVTPSPEMSSLTTATPSRPDSNELGKVYTDNLTSIAIEQLSRGNLEKGDRAVVELLDRNALPLAEAALNAVPPEQQDRANILFLKGRLAWQSVLTGDPDYSVDDARRYWELAVEQAPENIEYQNALGFAYYEEGDYDRANQTWSKAIELGQQKLVSTETQQDDPLLTTYAGLAIAFSQIAADDNQTDNTQTTLINKAIKLRQMVLAEAPLEFQTDSLSQNWLWSEQAIQDWQDAIDVTE